MMSFGALPSFLFAGCQNLGAARERINLDDGCGD